ncbi:sensor histidine kinase [Qaidamihabitans albus]|uniref:sensor histidine kinase n=1 Tax=Qaidamihabitans albus TaxID=2795733 RepID=UPI0018F1871C|nr:HAMP domain-containing sensor histidine kinase [Qaidamihabitans albus]
MIASIARLLLVCCSVTLVGVLTAYVVVDGAETRARQRAEAQIEVAALVAVVLIDPNEEALRRALARIPAGRRGGAGVHLPPGGRKVGTARAPVEQVRDTARSGVRRTVDTDAGRFLLVPVSLDSGRTAVVEVRTADPWFGEAAGTRLLVLAGAGVLAAAASMLIVMARARKLAETAGTLGESAESLGSGRPVPGVPRETPPELVRLRDALAGIAAHWSRLRTDERKLVADLSHRLRTPLTALRLDAEALGDEPNGERIRRSISALESEVDSVIRSSDSAEPTDRATPDLAEVVRSRMSFWTALAENQQRHCEVELTARPTPVGLTEKDVRGIVDNLLVNVFRHTAAGTPLAVFVVEHAGWITLVVDDGGPGIVDPDFALRRGSSGRGSTGLGLDITRRRVERLGGSIHVESSSLGGARVRLRLPTAGTRPREQPHRAWRMWQLSTRSNGR